MLVILVIFSVIVLLAIYFCMRQVILRNPIAYTLASEYQTWLNEQKEQIQTIEIKVANKLTLRGYLFQQTAPTNQWIIIVHGHQSDQRRSFVHAKYFYEQGFNILTYDLRAHGTSDGHAISMGINDKDDLLCWINALLKRYPKAQITLHGTSMGGATVLMCAGLKDLPKQVIAVIDDCGFSDVMTILKQELNKLHIPSFPLLHLVDLTTYLLFHFWLHEGKVLDYVKQIKLPILIIHGKADEFIYPKMSQQVFATVRHNHKQLLLFDQAKHALSHVVDPKNYYRACVEFIRQSAQ